MILIFARHGETEFGKEEKLEGVSDSPLTEKGEHQVRLLVEFCKKKKIGKIFSSPLNRSLTTAKGVSKVCNLKVNIVEDLREVCYGKWEGKTKDNLVKLKIWKKREENLFEFIHPGKHQGIRGESYEFLYHRLKPFFKKLTREEKLAVLIVAHLGVVRCAMKYFDKIDNKAFAKFRIPNHYAYIMELKNGEVRSKITDFTDECDF